MSLSLIDVKRIATDVARQRDPALEVVAATPGEEGTGYSELIITVQGSHREPCRLLIGVNRDATEREIRERFEEHLAAR